MVSILMLGYFTRVYIYRCYFIRNYDAKFTIATGVTNFHRCNPHNLSFPVFMLYAVSLYNRPGVEG